MSTACVMTCPSCNMDIGDRLPAVLYIWKRIKESIKVRDTITADALSQSKKVSLEMGPLLDAFDILNICCRMETLGIYEGGRR